MGLPYFLSAFITDIKKRFKKINAIHSLPPNPKLAVPKSPCPTVQVMMTLTTSSHGCCRRQSIIAEVSSVSQPSATANWCV